ncbi:MAG: amino acid adenylation domain-containing protein [Symploca sp. SIO2D2]|nr:amino acid adenylation domain-containing protein [Symploca sp. SIO2D2]
MNIVEFVQDLKIQGWQLWSNGEKMGYRAPNQESTQFVLSQLKQHKTEVLQLLNDQPELLQVFLLSYGQQAMWFLWKLAPKSCVYNVSMTTHIRSQVNVGHWRQAFQSLRKRHPILRSNFTQRGQKPIQLVQEHQELDFLQIDATTWSQDELDKRLVKAHQHPFDLEKEAVMRIRWFTRSEQEHILLLTIHHIAVDGWSLDLILKDLPKLYQIQTTDVELSLPPLKHFYQDYVQWQQEMLEGTEGKRLWNYWQQQLAGELPVLNLPTDRPRPTIQTYNGAAHYFQLSEKLSEQLKEITQKEKATLYTTLLAAFQILLYRYTAQEDILVGSPTSGRNCPEFAPIVGYFVEPVVMRSKLSNELSFLEFLAQVRQTVLEALDHQGYPFALLVDKLLPKRDLSRSPIFQVFFILQKIEQWQKLISGELSCSSDWHGIKVETYEIPIQESQFDLSLEMMPISSCLGGFFRYNTDLFERETIVRMAGHFQTLLEAIVANPQQKLSELPLLKPTEEQQILSQWNNTKTDYPSGKCIHELFEVQVERTPNAIAVVFEEQKLTYSQVNSKANQLAHYLQKLGVRPEVLVGICVERSLEMLIGLLAILKAGGVYVPLDPRYPSERLNYMLADSQASVLLTQEKLLDKLPKHQTQSHSSLNKQQFICLDADWGEISQENHNNVDNGVTSDNLAYVIYTSGSTGKPKGVQIYHRSLTNFLMSMSQAPGITNSDILLAVTSICFDIAALELYLPLIVGAKLVIVSREVATDGKQLLSALDHAGATIMQGTPATWQMLLTVGWEGSSHNMLPSKQEKTLKILCGGEALPHKLGNQLLDRGAEVWNMYGPTETTIWSSVCNVTPSAKANNVKASNVSYSIGKPIANTQIYILDCYLQPVPIGVPGELHIGGEGLARGYLNQAELTADKFIPHSFSKKTEDKLYKTGDLGRYLQNGQIEFLGRIDNQVKIRGFRIETGEIEAILNQNPAVKETVVVARKDNSEDQRLVAYIVLNQQQESTQESPLIPQIRQLIQQQLPEYMVPAAFVLLDTFPLTPNGKIDRRALPAPEITSSSLSTTYVIPQTETQRRIAIIWREVLKVEKVGIYDNFFELGGHSLLLLKVHTQLQELYSLKTSIVELFQYPTISTLSQHLIELERKQVTDSLTTGQAKSRGVRKTSIKQQRLQRQQHRRNK